MGDLWRRRKWRLLLNLVDHLPRDSHMADAMLGDEELAREQLDNPSSDNPLPKFSEWSGVRDDLAALNDRLDRLTAVLLGVNGNKAPSMKPYPRPEPALQRLRMTQESERRRAFRERIENLPRV